MAALLRTSSHCHFGLGLGLIHSIRRFSLMRLLRSVGLFFLPRPIHLFIFIRPTHHFLHTIPLRPTFRPVRPGLRSARGPILHETGLDEGRRGREGIDALLGRLQPGRHKGLLEIVDDVLDVFQAEAHADEIGGDAAFDLLFVGQLLVRGDPRVDDEGLCVADVGEVAAELQVVDDGPHFVDVARLAERLATHPEGIYKDHGQRVGGGTLTYHAKSKHAARAVGHRLLRSLVILVGFQARVEHPADARVRLEPLGERLRVLHVAFAAEGQGLQPLEEEPGVEGAHARSQVAHRVHAQLGGQGFVPVRLPEPHAVVAVRGLREFGELAAGAPVEVASVDHDAAHARAVAADPFGAAVGDDVGAQ